MPKKQIEESLGDLRWIHVVLQPEDDQHITLSYTVDRDGDAQARKVRLTDDSDFAKKLLKYMKGKVDDALKAVAKAEGMKGR